MICQYNLLFLFLCVFTALSVSTKECGDNLVGDSCILKLPEQFNKEQNNIKWTHSSSYTIVIRKRKTAAVRSNNQHFTMEEDGSLKCLQLALKDKGDYVYVVEDSSGTELIKAVKKINVYEKAPKPEVTVKCTPDGNATLSCDIGKREDLTVSWFKEKTPIPNAKTPQVFLSSIQVQEYKEYSCEAHNPVSAEQSEIITVSCVEVKKAVGDEVSFRPDKPLPSPVNSIIWKHKNNDGVVVKVIEWDEDGFFVLNDRFKDITILDVKTGEIKIKHVDVSHIGEYFFEVNSKEQGEKFTLIVNDQIPKPVIKIEKSEVNNVLYLSCEYSDKSDQIIWKNSAGETLTVSAITPRGESITVKKKGNPENFYTCTLRNDVSEKTSDPIYEKDLFTETVSPRSSASHIASLTDSMIFIILFLFIPHFI